MNEDGIINSKLNFSEGNKFFIYGDIDETIPEMIIAPLYRRIDEISALKNPPQLDFFISSDGGYANYALDVISAFDVAKTKGIRINTIVTSNAGSAASLIAVCGHYRVASEYATFLLHFARSMDYAHNPDMAERNLESRKFLDKQIVHLYKAHTKIKEIEKKFLADNYMIHGGKELKKLGVIDEIL